MNWLRVWNAMSYNKPLKYVPATKSVASTGLADARRLAGRSGCRKIATAHDASHCFR
jgi:hypothetical protein